MKYEKIKIIFKLGIVVLVNKMFNKLCSCTGESTKAWR